MSKIDPKPPRRRLVPKDMKSLVLDAKIAYGHVRCKVTPLDGAGATWLGNLEVEYT